MDRSYLQRVIAFAAGICLSLVLLELVLRLLPGQRGFYGSEPDARWPAHHLAPNANYTYSINWDFEDVQHGHVNNMGYVSPFDYERGTSGVFVVGDSFVEDMMTGFQDSLQGRLPSLLTHHLPVLGFGTAGGSLAHDVGVAGMIGEQFSPTWAVVLVTRENFTHGFGGNPGYFAWTTDGPPGVELLPARRHSALALAVRKTALATYARGNLKADWSSLFAARRWEPSATCHPGKLSGSDEALIQFAAKQLPGSFRLDPPHVILLLDGNRSSMYTAAQAKPSCPSRDDLALALLGRLAEAQGIKVIDMDPVFRAAYSETHQHYDFLPADGHWNAAGHALAAREVASYINASAP